DEVAGAEVRLRYHVDSDERDSARAVANEIRAAILEAGALSVKLEEVVRPTTRARTPEIAQRRDLEGMLRALWASRNDAPDEERAARLVEMARELEEAAA